MEPGADVDLHKQNPGITALLPLNALHTDLTESCQPSARLSRVLFWGRDLCYHKAQITQYRVAGMTIAMCSAGPQRLTDFPAGTDSPVLAAGSPQTEKWRQPALTHITQPPRFQQAAMCRAVIARCWLLLSEAQTFASVFATLYAFDPRRVFKVPADCLIQTGCKVLLRLPTKFRLNF